MFSWSQAFDAVAVSFLSKYHVSLGEPSHVSKHPSIEQEVQIQESRMGVGNRISNSLLFFLFIYLGVLNDDPNKPNADPSKIPGTFYLFYGL